MMLLNIRSSLVAALAALICTLSAVVFSGCSPAPAKKPGQTTPPKASPAAQPAEKPAEPAAKPADKPAEPQAMLAEPAGKVGSDASAAPKVSTFAPAQDLANQADWFIKKLEETVASEADYKDGEGNIGKGSNTLIVIALALGLHDQPSKYKGSAGALMKAAQAVAATKDYESAKKAVAALKAAAAAKSNADVELKWEKVAALPELMKQVPLVNNKLKRNVKPEKFKKKAKDTAGYTAVIAAIAQGSIADLSETKSPEQVKQWQEFSRAMRDEAGAVNAAIHKGDEPAAAKAMEKLNQSCEDCHAVFHPEAKEAMQEQEKED